MSYKRIKWLDHIVQRPRTYRVTKNTDGTETLAPEPGTIIQQGTAQSANNFNNAEEGLQHYAAAFDWLSTIVNALKMQIALLIDMILNVNILDNGFFQINQRGKNSYSGSSGYSLDRWKRTSNASIVTVNENGVSISAVVSPSVYANVYQPLELERFKLCKWLTISILYADGHVESATGQYLGQETNLATKPYKNSFVMLKHAPDWYTEGLVFNIRVEYSHTANIIGVCVESGRKCTIQNMPLPDEAVERIKCMAYYQFYEFFLSSGVVNNAIYRFPVYLGVSMRKTPSVTLKEWLGRTSTGFSKYTGSSKVKPTDLRINDFAGNYLVVYDVVTTSNDTNNSIVNAMLYDLELSADL